MAIYDKKDSVHTCKTLFTRVNTGEMKKCKWLHLIYGIRMSYFWSGSFTIKPINQLLIRILLFENILGFFKNFFTK